MSRLIAVAAVFIAVAFASAASAQPDPLAGASAKPQAGFWSGTTAQHRSVRFEVRDTSGVWSVKTYTKVKCKDGAKGGGKIYFWNAEVEKGAFVGRDEYKGYLNVIHGEFSSPTKVSGTLRSEYPRKVHGGCESGKVHWSAKFSSPFRG